MKEIQPPNCQTCPTITSQIAKVCLPVDITPFAVTGPFCVECCDDPVISKSCHKDPHHCDHEKGSCMFTISQKIRIDIPVEFGASVKYGKTFVDCFDMDHIEIECECKEEEKK